MNVAQQTGASDCGLYALAILTCLANNMDPTTVVFDNEELRPHLAKILETRKIAPFPVSKHRKPANSVGKVQSCLVYCPVGCLMMVSKWCVVTIVMNGFTVLVNV